MNLTKKHILFFAWTALLFSSCLEPYAPPVVNGNVDILVVDGFLNMSTATASVRLSHALPLDSAGTPAVETNATVQLEEGNGPTIALANNADGTYIATGLSIDPSKKYRLHVLVGGKEYYSDYVDALQTPDIDSVTWRASDKDVTIYVNTHDATGKTKYYLWTYVETYEYAAPYPAGYEMKNGEPVYMSIEERTDICWKTTPSTTILVNSSENLSSDLIRNFPITVLEAGSYPLSRRYSTLVSQRAISKEAYTFWLQLQKTTESIGSLFDPMPSQVVGNVHSATDVNEVVLGFFSASEEKQMRMFVKNSELPENIRRTIQPFCPIDSLKMDRVRQLVDHTKLIAPYGVPITLGYTSSTSLCMDCRERGGVPQKPDFW